MLLKSLASTYAEAFIDNLKPEQYAEAHEDLTTFAELCVEEPRIKLLLGNPAIPDDEKLKLVGSIADRGRFLKLSKHFLMLLLENERLGILSDVAESFLELVREHEGREVANVTAAVELSDEQVERLRNKLSEYLKKNIDVNVTVDRSLIGGMVIRVGDKIIDSSIVNSLNTLRESLIEGWKSENKT